ncbi:MAG: DUF6232 family protein [Candidatus Competibacteraceae bacterium]|jgi:hypothetical protein|nr:DUF6232 family protein [Candidatus Competibacteraceae bacterium]
MQKSQQIKILMDEDDFQITTKQVNTPIGDYPLSDIQGVASRITKPVWGPLLLAILGTINLAIAFHAGYWLDFVTAGIMLGAGLVWWTRGTKYVLILTLPKGDVDAWTARHESQVKQALDMLQQSLHKR